MPLGPLSVREFVLEPCEPPEDSEKTPAWDAWICGQRTEVFTTQNEDALQSFAVLPPVEGRYVKFTALSNAHRAMFPDSRAPHTAVGLWELRFA